MTGSLNYRVTAWNLTRAWLERPWERERDREKEKEREREVGRERERQEIFKKILFLKLSKNVLSLQFACRALEWIENKGN